METAGSDVRLWWSANAPGYGLVSNTNLSSANWSTVTPAPVLESGNYVVTNAAAGLGNFYRLQKP